MILYAETSAVLAWILGERAGESIRTALAEAEVVVASDLTLIECDRVLIRGVATMHLREAEAASRRGQLMRAATHWVRLALDEAIVDRARRSFPREPVRTLDAIHLATALVARSVVPELNVLALDQRIRDNAHELGFEVVPELM